MTTQQTNPHQTAEPTPHEALPVPTQRRRPGWWSLLDAGEPFAPAAGEPQAWARRAHAPHRPARRWTEADDGRPVVTAAPHLASRPFFARYPLLGASRY